MQTCVVVRNEPSVSAMRFDLFGFVGLCFCCNHRILLTNGCRYPQGRTRKTVMPTSLQCPVRFRQSSYFHSWFFFFFFFRLLFLSFGLSLPAFHVSGAVADSVARVLALA